MLGVAAFVRSALVVAAVVLVLAPTASASSPEFDPGIDRETHLLSQTFNGTWPDGPETVNVELFSDDGSIARENVAVAEPLRGKNPAPAAGVVDVTVGGRMVVNDQLRSVPSRVPSAASIVLSSLTV